MMRENILTILNRISNLKWRIKFYVKSIVNQEFKKQLRSNEKFKNLHEGEKCFIIGNAPSLRKMDLSKLKNEITLTVNNIINDEHLYKNLNSNYHFLMDPTYYNLDTSKREDIEKIKKLKTIKNKQESINPFCFINYEGKEKFQSYGLARELNLKYLYSHKHLIYPYSKNIDMSKNLPISQNVIQAAMYCAIYMGFKEIYLIGCDMTSIFLNFEKSDKGHQEIKKEFHAYNYSKNEMKTMLKNSNAFDNEYILYNYAQTFTIFKHIRKYAEINSIKIINAGVGGGLDVFERVDFETIF